MKHIALAAALFLTLSANTCTKKEAAMASIRDTKWVLQTLGGEAVKVTGEQPWLQLEGDRLKGFGGCNSLMGQVKTEGEALSFSSVGSTKMYCEGVQPVEEKIKGMLGQVDGYKMDGGTLKLMGGGKELATLKGE
jgi:heat shock protein HslJ